MENSLFIGSDQNGYYSEAYSEHCKTSKMERLEKIIEDFEPLTFFAKRSILNVWQGSEYAPAADTYFGLGKKLIQLQELSRLFKGRNIKLLFAVIVVRSIFSNHELYLQNIKTN